MPFRSATGTAAGASFRSMECAYWLVTLPSIDGRRYVYRVYAPDDALPADLFWDAWHCHDEGPHPRAFDVFDAAEIRRPR